MFRVRPLEKTDREKTAGMVRCFYQSDAVDHQAPEAVIQKVLSDVLDHENCLLKAFALCEDDEQIGYAYITEFYACETAGSCVMIEEIFIAEEFRGKGYGTAFFRWLFETYAGAARFRLEITDSNERALELYRRLGFIPLSYGQMVYDVPAV